jgi:hypothetical protein
MGKNGGERGMKWEKIHCDKEFTVFRSVYPAKENHHPKRKKLK